jgi:hypothetical protein
VLGGAFALPALQRYRGIIRGLLIVFAVTTFVMYFLVNGFRFTPIAVVDKIAELSLIVLLLIDARQSRSVPAVGVIPAGAGSEDRGTARAEGM